MNQFAFLSPLITTLVGFVSGWALFELTERRRRNLAQRELRKALVAELENGEVLASINVAKYARFCQTEAEVAFVASEIRWFLSVGRSRMEVAGVLSALPPTSAALETLSDQQLVDLYSRINETLGSKMIFPIVESTLAGQTSGFTAEQIKALSMVRWHAHLLAQDADAMAESLRMSFTVTDDVNHPRVIDNHQKRSASYAHRAQVLLSVIRKGLRVLA